MAEVESQLEQQTAEDPEQIQENTGGEGEEDGDVTPSYAECGKIKSRMAEAKKISTGDRLTTHREVAVDVLKGTIEKPAGYLPPAFFPAWPEMAIESKLPQMLNAAGTVFFSRGKLGKKILHDPKYFTIYDPNHQERVIRGEYNALHDPHAKGYLKKGMIKKLLLKQGLITKTGQVLCSARDFNNYRTYLSTLYHDDIQNKFQEMALKELEIRKTNAELKKYFSRTEADLRTEHSKLQQEKVREARIQRMVRRQHEAEEREAKWKIEEAQKRSARQLLSFELEEARRLRLAQYKESLQEKQLNMTIMRIQKENRITERNAMEKQLHKEMDRRVKTAWVEHKYEFQQLRLQKEHEIKAILKSAFIERAKRRQKRVENYRDNLPQIIEKQKIARERVWNLVKKFFYRWLNKVRERRDRKPDQEHLSLWDVTENFDETVKYLHQESGVEKLDDFILGLMRAIKEEEAAEAAKLAAEEEDEGLVGEPPVEAAKEATPPPSPPPPEPVPEPQVKEAPAEGEAEE